MQRGRWGLGAAPFPGFFCPKVVDVGMRTRGSFPIFISIPTPFHLTVLRYPPPAFTVRVSSRLSSRALTSWVWPPHHHLGRDSAALGRDGGEGSATQQQQPPAQGTNYRTRPLCSMPPQFMAIIDQSAGSLHPTPPPVSGERAQAHNTTAPFPPPHPQPCLVTELPAQEAGPQSPHPTFRGGAEGWARFQHPWCQELCHRRKVTEFSVPLFSHPWNRNNVVLCED